MTPEDYLASKQIILPIPQGVVELVSIKDALKAVRMARGENVGRVEPMKGIPRIQVKDLSHMTEQEAIAYIDSLGAFGYNTSARRATPRGARPTGSNSAAIGLSWRNNNH